MPASCKEYSSRKVWKLTGKNSFYIVTRAFRRRARNIGIKTVGDCMLDVNMIIANNLQAELKKKDKKQTYGRIRDSLINAESYALPSLP